MHSTKFENTLSSGRLLCIVVTRIVFLWFELNQHVVLIWNDKSICSHTSKNFGHFARIFGFSSIIVIIIRSWGLDNDFDPVSKAELLRNDV